MEISFAPLGQNAPDAYAEGDDASRRCAGRLASGSPGLGQALFEKRTHAGLRMRPVDPVIDLEVRDPQSRQPPVRGRQYVGEHVSEGPLIQRRFGKATRTLRG
jgi:hypothetical protein